MKFDRKNYSNKFLLELYKQLLVPRLIEEKMLILLRQGKISKWFSGIGQEAVSVGATMALDKEEYILPLHRNLGIFTARNIPLKRLFAQFQGKQSGFTQGRDRSFHFGSQEHHIIGMISHLGPQLSVADGIALGHLLEGSSKVTLAFTGDGGSSEGEFHEALNVASVWKLPVIFLVENNGYSISTPTSEQYAISSFQDKGAAYNIETKLVDGNNVLEVYTAIKSAAKSMRSKPRPILIETTTFRMRGHEESSGTDFVPQELFEKWAKKDPIKNFEDYLRKEKLLDEDIIRTTRKNLNQEIEASIYEVFDEPEVQASTEKELSDLFAKSKPQPVQPSTATKNIRFIDAIRDGLEQNMNRHEQLVLMGQDIAEYGGVFKATEGLAEKFGKDRVRNTPLCESAILGVGLGLSIVGHKSVVEMQFADFVTCGFNQIVNNLAKSHYRWGQTSDVVVRMPTGAGVGAGPFHSQSTEAWFFRVPGLKIVFPSNPRDAKGLLNAAIADPNPVLFYEHKALYRSVSGEVPEGYYETPIGKGQVVQEGEDLSIITYGLGVQWAKEYAEKHADESIEIVDLRSLLPWDKDLVKETTSKTGRVLLLCEDTHTGSIMAEIASWIGEELFQYLDAPVKRLGSLDTPIPFAAPLEENFLAKNRLPAAIEDLSNY